ncbi:MAG: phosphohistidine phosphatase SixA [Planctomycetota bacterium]|jgi:phosphohistidine phosphatase SixA
MRTDRRSFLALAPLAPLTPLAIASGALVQEPAAPKVASTVILVRHAETAADTNTTRDPELSEAGQERAESLGKLFAAAGVTHLFSSEYKRTAATLAPLAKSLGLKVEVVSARDPMEQVQAILELPAGSVAAIAGHSNTTPGLFEALGGNFARHPEAKEGAPTLMHDQHGRIFVATGSRVDGTALASLELRY